MIQSTKTFVKQKKISHNMGKLRKFGASSDFFKFGAEFGRFQDSFFLMISAPGGHTFSRFH